MCTISPSKAARTAGGKRRGRASPFTNGKVLSAGAPMPQKFNPPPRQMTVVRSAPAEATRLPRLKPPPSPPCRSGSCSRCLFCIPRTAPITPLCPCFKADTVLIQLRPHRSKRRPPRDPHVYPIGRERASSHSARPRQCRGRESPMPHPDPEPLCPGS